jgi:hypothetical protein
MSSPRNTTVEPDPRGTERLPEETKSLVPGLMIAAIVFGYWLFFSSAFVTFYRDDNVTCTLPLVIDAARQVRSGHFPWHTYFVGGGGGSPIVAAMQPGALNPLKLIPALFLCDRPETLMNVIASLHLAILALGGWFLATSLAAPAWAGFVAAFSLGFSGAFVIGVGSWEMNYLPYAFLPWMAGSIIRLAEAESRREIVSAHLLLGWSALSTFFGGGPTAIFYAVPVTAITVLYVISGDRSKLGVLALRSVPQVVLVAVLAGPLLWEAKKVFDYYGRKPDPMGWVQLSVPLRAYLGLWIPGTESTWTHIGRVASFTNYLLFCGLVPVWYIFFAIFKKPAIFARVPILCLVAGIILFVPLLSPDALGLSEFFSRVPALNVFRWPFRGIPAFDLLLVFLFLAVAKEMQIPQQPLAGALLVFVCFMAGILSVSNELRIAVPGYNQISWFITNRYYEDPERWDEGALEKLRSSGYVVTLSRRAVRGVFFEKPRLYFSGNLGAQYRVCTVHRYLFGAQAEAYNELGMHYSGQNNNLNAVKRFLASSLTKPPDIRLLWDNGIGPKDFKELAAKTYVGAAIVETSFKEPMDYFLTSPQWRLLESRPSASLFLRVSN